MKSHPWSHRTRNSIKKTMKHYKKPQIANTQNKIKQISNEQKYNPTKKQICYQKMWIESSRGTRYENMKIKQYITHGTNTYVCQLTEEEHTSRQINN